MRTQRHFAGPLAATAMVTALLLSGCSGAEAEAESDSGDHDDQSSAEANAEQVDQPQPRLVTTYDGGILTLNAETLDVIDDTPLEGFNRVNPVGDGRHVMVSVAEGFRLFDAGAWSEEHGDHSHSFAGVPTLTDTVYETDTPGHVVRHGGSTVLFGDGDGRIQIFDTEAFGDGPPEPEVTEAEEPHHGVAVQLDDGAVLHTIGNEEERSGAKVVDAEGKEIARSEDCPGVHGEAAAQDEAIAVGCEDGILYFKDGKFTKVDSPDSYGRIGNQAGSDDSPVVLGDYKVDEDAELERPEKVTLTDTDTGKMKLVDLDSSYSFRSLARGPEGEALVLGTDGELTVIDAESGKITDSHPVTDKWEEPVDWQQPRPTLFVQGDKAYVSEPDKSQLHMVDLSTGEVEKSAELPHAGNEVTGVTG
ncbi:zinc metallochaperone AztD [Brevibacterium marinum]|uniref:Outer membrane protein assembly factor BamB n=1 Tax=Brevibacterium marinum TaxID=418643 RepID=A0A846RX69_9MICO|nr:zinc metallochaperone AztD [Brevibacterium marinum]NJC56035.1 outer membrane protein assembly factor BamB [Brevibacterium marinum]